MWERKTLNLRGVYKADKAIVNCVQPHPTLPLIATSGIDHEIAIWNPRPVVSSSLNSFFQFIKKRNFQDEPGKCRIESTLIDKIISENQQHLTDDTFEFGAETICRTS